MEAEAVAGVPETPEEFAKRRDALVVNWIGAKAQLAGVKTAEMEYREQVTAMLFPTPKKGTQRYHLGNGHNIKLVHGTNYTLGDKDLIEGEGEAARKVPTSEQVDRILDEIALVGNEGGELAEKLVKWKPELNEAEYLALDPENPSHVKIKALIDSILTTKPASPQLEYEQPKPKK